MTEKTQEQTQEQIQEQTQEQAQEQIQAQRAQDHPQEPTYVCAVFDDTEQVRRAALRLRARGIDDELLRVIEEPEELLSPANAPHSAQPKRGMQVGALLGATLGMALGVLLTGPLGFAGLGGATGAAFGAGSGAMFGGLGGTLVGSDLPDETLLAMADALEDGQVLLVADVRDEKLVTPVQNIMTRRGGDVVSTI